MDFPIPIIWIGPISFFGLKNYLFILFQFSMKFMTANRKSPDGTPRSAASHTGLFCLHLSNKKDARLIYKLECMCVAAFSLSYERMPSGQFIGRKNY